MTPANTDNLITALAADTRQRALAPRLVWLVALALGVVASLAMFALAVGGVRADIATAAADPRFLLKFAVTLSLAAATFALVHPLSIPGRPTKGRSRLLLVPAAVLGAAVAAEVAIQPSSALLPGLVGANALVCLVTVPLLAIAPLALFILALRHAAPTRPALAGAVAGLLAGAIAATLYAAYCTDDSPLFVATWYSLSIGGLALVGAAAGSLFARW